jgi:stearoyl-CoA desaturase (delta-9 desaturase)
MTQGAELYRDESLKTETLEKYGRGCPDDWMENKVYLAFPFGGILALLVINTVLFGPLGITMFAIQMISMPVFAAGIINGVGHYYGYRNFECEDASTNIVPWAFVLGGEELHNNHHAFPSSAKFSVRRWEFDIGWLYIRVLSFLGLADVKKVAPFPVIEDDVLNVDLETVRAVIVNRMHVIRNYTVSVTIPTLRMEAARAEGRLASALRKAKKSLIRAPSLLDDNARQKLNAVLADNQALRTVHEFRERLQELWNGTTASNEKLIQELKEWCAQAEASGIKSLQEFAQTLRGYRVAAGTV